MVLNRDNALTLALTDQAKGQVTLFSRQNPLEEGVVLENNIICVKKAGTTREVLPVEEILIPGVHNIENFQGGQLPQ